MAITDEGAVVEPTEGGDQQTIAADTVVIAIGFRPRPTHAEDYKGLGAEVYEIGDCRKVANILTAIWDGYEVAHTL